MLDEFASNHDSILLDSPTFCCAVRVPQFSRRGDCLRALHSYGSTAVAGPSGAPGGGVGVQIF
jgi:hypothetical protein